MVLATAATLLGTVAIATPALATDVVMFPTPYDYPYYVTGDAPKADIFFYEIDHAEDYTLYRDGEPFRTIHITQDMIGTDYNYKWFPGWGHHDGYVTDSSGTIVQDFFSYGAYHVELKLRRRPNPVDLTNGELMRISVCYAVDKPVDYDYPNVARVWVNGYREWNGIEVADGGCTLVDRWDGSNNWGEFQQPNIYSYVLHAGVRFGPFRQEETTIIQVKRPFRFI